MWYKYIFKEESFLMKSHNYLHSIKFVEIKYYLIGHLLNTFFKKRLFIYHI